MADVVTRILSDQDLPGIARVYVDAFNAPPWSDGWSLDAAQERLRRILASPYSVGVLAEDAGVPVSFALGLMERWVRSEHFHLREMCTLPSRQGEGCGTRVLAALLHELQARSVRKIYLETHPGSTAAAFYRKKGFTPLALESLSLRIGAG